MHMCVYVRELSIVEIILEYIEHEFELAEYEYPMSLLFQTCQQLIQQHQLSRGFHHIIEFTPVDVANVLGAETGFDTLHKGRGERERGEGGEHTHKRTNKHQQADTQNT